MLDTIRNFPNPRNSLSLSILQPVGQPSVRRYPAPRVFIFRSDRKMVPTYPVNPLRVRNDRSGPPANQRPTRILFRENRGNRPWVLESWHILEHLLPISRFLHYVAFLPYQVYVISFLTTSLQFTSFGPLAVSHR